MRPLGRPAAAALVTCTLSTVGAWVGCTAGEAPTRDDFDAGTADGARGPGTSSGTTGGNGETDASGGGPGEPSDAAPTDAATDASPPGDAGPPPEIVGSSPETAAFGSAFTLRVDVTGALPGARVLVDGAPTTATVPDGGAGDGGDAGVTSLFVDVSAGAISHAGLVPVVVENVLGDATSQSAPIFLGVDQADGGPVVYDFLPDNGNPSDTITILGQNLHGTLALSDGQGGTANVTIANRSRAWGDLAAVEVASFAVPAGWHGGQPVLSGGIGAPVRAPTFNLGTDLAQEGTATASSSYSASFAPPRGIDNDLSTSWFAAVGDCATAITCTSVPFYEVALAAPTSIGRIALRGDREYASGYDLHRVRVDILGAAPTDAAPPDSPVLWSRDVALPAPTRDADLVVAPPVVGSRVRVTSLEDESDEPGLAELEVFAQ